MNGTSIAPVAQSAKSPSTSFGAHMLASMTPLPNVPSFQGPEGGPVWPPEDPSNDNGGFQGPDGQKYTPAGEPVAEPQFGPDGEANGGYC